MWGKSSNFAAEMEGKFIRPCLGLRPRRDSEERNGDRLRETSSIFIRPCFGLRPRRDFEERNGDRLRENKAQGLFESHNSSLYTNH